MNHSKELKHANERLLSLFTNGYIAAFVYSVYGLQGLNATKMLERNLVNILDGVLPKKLNEIFTKQNELRQLAEDMDDHASVPEMFTENQNPKYFQEAQQLARNEADLYVDSGSAESAHSWYDYLAGRGAYNEI